MLTTIKQRLGRDDEQGFTLIELMVVVLIIAILLAIAIPTFLGARNSANARSAQSNLRNALTSEQTQWTNNQVFDATIADMQGVESNLTWVNAAPTAASNPNTVAVYLGTNSLAGDTVYLQAFAKDGNCYTIEQTDDPAFVSANPGAVSTGYAVTKGGCKAPAAGTAPVVPTQGAGQAGQAGSHIDGTVEFPTAFYASF